MGQLLNIDFSKRAKDLYYMTKTHRIVTVEENHYEATSLRNDIHMKKSSKIRHTKLNLV